MKTIKRICQFILLVFTLFIWTVFVCGTDSLLENGILFPAIMLVAFATYLCHLFIKKEDLETMFHTKIEDDEI